MSGLEVQPLLSPHGRVVFAAFAGSSGEGTEPELSTRAAAEAL